MMKHQEDDGDLSIIAQDDTILIACNQGHYWLIPSQVQQPADHLDAVAAPFLAGSLARSALGFQE